MKHNRLLKLITVIVAVIAVYLAFHISRGVSQYNRGTSHLAEGQYDQAIACFTKAIKREGKFPEAYCNRGTAYYEIGQYDEAIRDFNRAIELNPESSQAFYNRAMVYYYKRQYDRAWDDINRAQDLGHYVVPDVFEALRENLGADR
ncbi:MAG: tetratricopeptide repeat protein [Phycisphaerales bacterium]|nr:MAG: tetratricopeptide repeat protein [Phycisphaerales bacterium]